MTRLRPLSTTLLGLAYSLAMAMTLLMAGAGASPAVSAVGGDPGFEQPLVGACYDMTWEEALGRSPDEPPVPCEEPHTLRTIKVKRLATPVSWDDPGLYLQYFTACHKAFYEALGGPRKAVLSAYEWWFFFPNQAQRDAGAAWVRCDIGIMRGTKDMPALPDTLKLGPLPLPKRYAGCLVGVQFHHTACAFRHAWKATVAFKLDRLARSREEFQRQGRRCGQKLGARTWVYGGPSLTEWRAGNHLMVCYKRHS